MDDGRQDLAYATGGPTWDRLEDQIGWYDTKSMSAQRTYKQLKVLHLVVAGSRPGRRGHRGLRLG